MPFDPDVISGIEHGIDRVDLIQVDQISFMTAEPPIRGQIRFPVGNTVPKEILSGSCDKDQFPKYHFNILSFLRTDDIELPVLICDNAELSGGLAFLG